MAGASAGQEGEPMIYAVLILIVVIAFLLGVTFVYKGISEEPQAALEDFGKVKGELAASRQTEERLKAGLEFANKEIGLVKKNLEEAQSSLQKSQQELAAVQDSEKSYKSKIRDLEEKLTALYAKADTQAKNALELISALRQENESLKQKAETPPPSPAPPTPDPGAVQTLTKEAETLKAQSQELSTKIQELEQELASQKSESEKQIAEAHSTIESLKAQPTAAPTAVPSVPVADDIGKADFENLRSENEQLKAQIAEGLEKIKEFENTVAQLNARPVAAAPAVPSEADLAEQAELKRVNEDLKVQIEAMRKTVEQLKAENAASAAKPADGKGSVDLEAQISKLQEFNEFLTKKEKMLQNELTKSRVKALGLERICADFKTQLEMMAQRAVKA